jgi:Domain of unknown function (DUF4349)/Prokaryotic membrane lipoprotein lipid attachment site
MESDMKKILLATTALLAVTACSKSEDASQNAAVATESVAADASASTKDEGSTPPDIAANVAPGVAFDFNYAFSLPEAKIAQAQEAHAALCGKLGISRCRVTGLTFSKERDGDITANMAFKIDPALALSFGRDATELVEQVDGKLETSHVSGEDVGTKIVAGDKNAAQIRADLARIDVQLAIPKLSSQVRQQLLEEARDLKSQLASIRSDRDDQVESLATTPMQFSYEPSEAVFGFQRGSAMQTGLSTGSASLGAMSTMLATVIGGVGPWAVLIAFGVWLFRRLRKTKPVANSEL